MGTPLRVHYDIVIKSYLLIGNAKRETERERKKDTQNQMGYKLITQDYGVGVPWV